ncbi:MAG TPA: DAK2 domain-containing protein [Bacillota bacterium]|nr:DAK2 domain-containing protein [Bacillota bacterium]
MVYKEESRLILEGLAASSRMLDANRERLNRLNFFPVADMDTGTNMALSARGALGHLKKANGDASAAELLKLYYEGLLEHGRGNSGTILAMLAGGFCSVMEDGKPITGELLARAFKRAAEAACSAVPKVKDGTMLSVAKEAAEAGASFCELTQDARLIWKRITEEAHASLSMTAFRNPVLRQYGVADAGAFGLCLILDGMFSVLLPEEKLPSYDFSEIPRDDCTLPPEPPYPYCTELFVKKNAASDLSALSAECEALGDCFLCVENGDKFKLHIHTLEPDAVTGLTQKYGEIISKKVDDMRVNTRKLQ